MTKCFVIMLAVAAVLALVLSLNLMTPEPFMFSYAIGFWLCGIQLTSCGIAIVIAVYKFMGGEG